MYIFIEEALIGSNIRASACAAHVKPEHEKELGRFSRGRYALVWASSCTWHKALKGELNNTDYLRRRLWEVLG